MNCKEAWPVNRSLVLAALLAAAGQVATAAVSCGIVSSSSTAFGVYDVLSTAPTDSLAIVKVRCDSVDAGNPNITLTMGIGTGSGSSVSSRRMRHTGGGSDVLNYGLFRDSNRSAVWGYTPGVDALTQVVKVQNNRLAEATFTIYGRVPALQDVATGEYSDTVQVTLSP